jgi:hypothetical protein
MDRLDCDVDRAADTVRVKYQNFRQGLDRKVPKA